MSGKNKSKNIESCGVNMGCNIGLPRKNSKDRSKSTLISASEQDTAKMEATKSKKITQSLEVAEPAQLCVQTGAYNIPRQDKVDYGGEDAYYISDMGGGTFGVADGVGSWNEAGINPGEYSRQFMNFCQKYIENKYYQIVQSVQENQDKVSTIEKMEKLLQPRDLREALNYAHQNTKLPGSSTACILALNQAQGKLYAANIGDSGFLVVRNQKVIFKSPDMQHFFDCPYQFGCYPKYVEQTDTARDAQIYEIDVKIGDIIIVATDGLWDNVAESEIARHACKHTQSDVQDAAETIAQVAAELSKDLNYKSPYVEEALTQGIDIPWWQKILGTKFADGKFRLGEFQGGKQDDITVIVAKIVTVEQKTSESHGLKSIVQPPLSNDEPSKENEQQKQNGNKSQNGAKSQGIDLKSQQTEKLLIQNGKLQRQHQNGQTVDHSGQNNKNSGATYDLYDYSTSSSSKSVASSP